MKLEELHSEIQAGILSYLSIHPDAADSAQGIHDGWLTNQRISPSINEVQTALDRLVEHGELHKNEDADLYAL
jgi:hypothetical protein